MEAEATSKLEEEIRNSNLEIRIYFVSRSARVKFPLIG